LAKARCKARHTHNDGRELGPERRIRALCVCVCVCVSVQESWLGLTRSVYRGASNAVHVDALTKDLQVLDPDLQVRLFLSSTFTDTILERNLLMAMVWPEVSRLGVR